MIMRVEAFIDKAEYEDRIICYHYLPSPKYKKKHQNDLYSSLYLAGREAGEGNEGHVRNPRIYPINLPTFKNILVSLSKEKDWPWGDNKWFDTGNFWLDFCSQKMVAWTDIHTEEVYYRMKAESNFEQEFFLPKGSKSSATESPDGSRRFILDERDKKTDEWVDYGNRRLVKLLTHSLIAKGLW